MQNPKLFLPASSFTQTPSVPCQYLVTLDANCPQETRDRKKPAVRRYTQQVKKQLRGFRELTSAILSKTDNQVGGKWQQLYQLCCLHAVENKPSVCLFPQNISSGLAPPFFPPLHLSSASVFHHSSPAPKNTQPERSGPEQHKQSSPQSPPVWKNTEPLESQPEGKVLTQTDGILDPVVRSLAPQCLNSYQSHSGGK